MGKIPQRWDNLKELSKTACVFTKEQVNALCGAAPMTQKIFEEVLDVCVTLDDLEGYLAVWNSFPQAARWH